MRKYLEYSGNPTNPPTPVDPFTVNSVNSVNSTYYYLYCFLYTYSTPRTSGKQRVENDISEYLLEMADMIETDDIQAFDSDNEILDTMDAFFDDLCYLEESQSKRYMATRYYSKANDLNNRNLPIEARLHPDWSWQTRRRCSN